MSSKLVPIISSTLITNTSTLMRTILSHYMISDSSRLNYHEVLSLKEVLSKYDTVEDNIDAIVDEVGSDLNKLYAEYYSSYTVDVEYTTETESIYGLDISISVIDGKTYNITESYNIDKGFFQNESIMIDYERGIK